MLLTIVTYVTAFLLFYRIITAKTDQEALSFLLVTSLLTISLAHLGNSASGGIFAFDIALVVYALLFMPPVASNLNVLMGTTPGFGAMLLIAVMAFVSALTNWAIEPGPWRFYFFCMFRYLQFPLVAMVFSTVRIRTGSVKSMFKPLIVGLAIYGIALLLHLRGIIPLDASDTYGGVEIEINEFSVQSWFMGTFKASYAGIISAGMFLLLAIMPFLNRRWRLPVGAICVLLAADVYLSTSRSDLIGLIGGLVCSTVVLIFTVPRWRDRVLISTLVVILLGGTATYFTWQRWDETSRERITEIWNSDLRASGSYRDRAHDQTALIHYMAGAPTELFLGAGPGNYGRYLRMNVTIIGLGHSSYRAIAGELGIVGLLALLYWCFQIATRFVFFPRSDTNMRFLSAIGIGLLVDRMLSAWSAGGLFDSFNMTEVDFFGFACIYLIFRLRRYLGRSQQPLPPEVGAQIATEPAAI